MTDQSSDGGREAKTAPARGRSTPRWVKVLAIVAIMLIVAFAISLIAGIQHGPGIHSSSARSLLAAASIAG